MADCLTLVAAPFKCTVTQCFPNVNQRLITLNKKIIPLITICVRVCNFLLNTHQDSPEVEEHATERSQSVASQLSLTSSRAKTPGDSKCGFEYLILPEINCTKKVTKSFQISEL